MFSGWIEKYDKSKLSKPTYESNHFLTFIIQCFLFQDITTWLLEHILTFNQFHQLELRDGLKQDRIGI